MFVRTVHPARDARRLQPSGRQRASRWRATAPPVSQETTEELVTALISQVQDSDNGLSLSDAQRCEVDGVLEQLAEVGRTQQPRPLDNEQLWGNYVVAYSSSRNAPGQRGAAAGGRFRGRVGRTLFHTEGLFQSVLKPDLAINKVAFRLFGIIPGFVGLRGRVVPEGGDADTVRVLFEPPVLSLFDALHFRIGPPSSVVLTTTYLDERVRLGRGSRGSLFVFTRGGAADEADMANVGLQRTTPAGKALLAGCLGLMVAGGAVLWASGTPGARVGAVGLLLIAAGLVLVLRRGGIVDGDDTAKQFEAYQQRLMQRRVSQQDAPPAPAPQ